VGTQVRHRTGFKKTLLRKVGRGVRTGRSQFRRVLRPRASSFMLMVTRLDSLAPPTRSLPNPLA
jgi:hypothetical protein